MTYEEARAEVDGWLAYVGDDAWLDIPIRTETLRLLLAGPPEPSVEEVKAEIRDGGGVDIFFDLRRVEDTAARVQALYRSKTND